MQAVRHSVDHFGGTQSAPPQSQLGRIVGRLRDSVRARWRATQRRREAAAMRAALSTLDERTLRDIGLHRIDTAFLHLEDSVRRELQRRYVGDARW